MNSTEQAFSKVPKKYLFIKLEIQFVSKDI